MDKVGQGALGALGAVSNLLFAICHLPCHLPTIYLLNHPIPPFISLIIPPLSYILARCGPWAWTYPYHSWKARRYQVQN